MPEAFPHGRPGIITPHYTKLDQHARAANRAIFTGAVLPPPFEQLCHDDLQALPLLHMPIHYPSKLAVAGSNSTRPLHNRALTGCTHSCVLGMGSCRPGGVPLQHIFAHACLVSCIGSLSVLLICTALA